MMPLETAGKVCTRAHRPCCGSRLNLRERSVRRAHIRAEVDRLLAVQIGDAVAATELSADQCVPGQFVQVLIAVERIEYERGEFGVFPLRQLLLYVFGEIVWWNRRR